MEEIVNKVAKSPLIVIDLEDFYTEGKRISFDIKDFLYEGLILKEKDFREALSNLNWNIYKDAYVAVNCSSDAIIPIWAYLLIATHLQNIAKKVIKGSLEDLESLLYLESITNLDTGIYEGKKVMIKGCNKKTIPDSAYVFLAERILPVVQSLMFGEACSTVPVFKKK